MVCCQATQQPYLFSSLLSIFYIYSMSAIYGKYNFFNGAVTSEELCVMESKLNHWNADDAGQWYHKAFGMGHLMLYNTPESLHEKLPLHKSENGLYITADARIDKIAPRFPMADICLVEYCLYMPNYLKYEGELSRTAYRKALSLGNYLPPEVLERNDKRVSMGPYRQPVTDEALVKAKQEQARARADELFKNLEGNAYIKPKALKARKINLVIFRWLEKDTLNKHV